MRTTWDKPRSIYRWCLRHKHHFLSCLLSANQERVPTVCQEAPTTCWIHCRFPLHPALHPQPVLSQASWMPKMCQTHSGESGDRDKKRNTSPWWAERLQGWDPWPNLPISQFRQSGKLLSWRFHPKIPLSHIIPQVGTAPTVTRKRHLSLSFPPTSRMSPSDCLFFNCLDDHCHQSAPTRWLQAQTPEMPHACQPRHGHLADVEGLESNHRVLQRAQMRWDQDGNWLWREMNISQNRPWAKFLSFWNLIPEFWISHEKLYQSRSWQETEVSSEVGILKRLLMKELGCTQGWGKDSESPQGKSTLGTSKGRESKSSRGEKVTIRVHLRAGAWKVRLLTTTGNPQSSRGAAGFSFLPLPAEPNQKLKVKSLASAVQRSRLLQHGASQEKDEDGYGAIRSIQVRVKKFLVLVILTGIRS